MSNDLASVVTGISFFLVGVVCLFFPDKIQVVALRYYDHHPWAGKLNPFLEWMKGRSYIISLRIIGLIGIAGSILLFSAFIRGQ